MPSRFSMMTVLSTVPMRSNRAKHSAREEHLGKMVFLNRNKEKYDWDNEDLSDVVDLSEDNPTLHNDIPAELPGVDLETDSATHRLCLLQLSSLTLSACKPR